MRHLIVPFLLAASLTLVGCGDTDPDSEGTTPTSDVIDAGAAPLDTDETMGMSDAATEPVDGESAAVDSEHMVDGESTPEADVVAEPAPEDADSSVNPEEPPSGSPCAFPLVELQTAKDPTCAGGNVHSWPIGMAPTACHGWRAVDTSGQPHDNSASAIGCGEDGSFTFTQFAGNLDCSGSGVVKTYTPEACEQDIPPVLYTKAINLACCEDLDHPDCITGLPSVTIPGGQVSLDGALCE
jgi:hypothetical protein